MVQYDNVYYNKTQERMVGSLVRIPANVKVKVRGMVTGIDKLKVMVTGIYKLKVMGSVKFKVR